MNSVEHLLTCLSEECSEIQQAVAKALRFGLGDGSPITETTNAYDIAKECVDFLAVLEMLESTGVLKKLSTQELIDKKKLKVLSYMEYARERGTLIDATIRY